MRKTKIVATLGPASYSEQVVAGLIEAGVDVFRFNFSHGTHDAHRDAYRMARSLSEHRARTIALIQDLQGPKIRVGELESAEVALVENAEVKLTSQQIKGNSAVIPIPYAGLEQEARPGETILMDDGKLRLEVLSVDRDGVICRVLQGGPLEPHKGVNFPQTALSTPPVTPKDLIDLRYGMELGFDAVALSFVSEASDIDRLRHEMRKCGSVRPIIAKLERAACLDHLDDILDASDAVMVARGDLGIEVEIERLPVLQKTIISKANAKAIPVITATQMLESMTTGLMPNRAEAADVANAVLDGSDALMLSAETSIGMYPVQTVQMMSAITQQAESFSTGHEMGPGTIADLRGDNTAKAVCHSAVVAAHDLELGIIVAITQSGQTALDMAALRPGAMIHAFASDRSLTNFLALSRGVAPHCWPLADDFEELMKSIDAQLLEKGIARAGETIAVVMGVPLMGHRATNSMIIRAVGARWKT